ncbi:MAG TPA: hypothetical protein VED63_04835 [Acidimicrobiales bacterium]|nr:hypothetical protein [Acidimicrobiales bacterium]
MSSCYRAAAALGGDGQIDGRANVINVITVHWQTQKWVDVQLGYLERNVDLPFRVFASLNGIDDPDVWRRFHFAEDLPGTHYEKLNALGRLVVEQADPEDLVVFLDGDAFPVRPLFPWVADQVAGHRLIAVRRDENPGDREPHASFCATTASFWDEIGGDWSNYGRVLLRQLTEAGVDWLPMLRTNTKDLHPLWFGIYAHRVYHHGAGFRDRVSKVDERAQPGLVQARSGNTEGLGSLARAVVRDPASLRRLRPRHVARVGRAVTRPLHRARRRQVARRAEPVSDAMFARLASDPDFYRDLDDAVF